ncbi:M24 family metallopeptidase [Fictibacillus sp. b24]|uniref:M24 family metallopeptidase n=1 Tax=Fictibacillus sp. b24 TaxID=3055863 RepID=UPI0025A04814|nr:M24 family metallopeptidase [Fictibacillus sp. b24]MDM5316277.1 M24 family metallopeptidase [Fictibacillus sp. b24]
MKIHTKENSAYITIKPLAERQRIMDEWLLTRLKQLLPALMKKHQTDMWVTIGKEYHEDPIGITFFPSAIDSSRRLTIFAFVKEKQSEVIKRYVISSNKQFEPFYSCYPAQKGEDSFSVLRKIMDIYQPNNIAVNTSSHYSFCDGLSHSVYKQLKSSIGKAHSSNLVSSENLSIDWLQTRISAEIETYKELTEITKKIVEQTFSNIQITPSVTSTHDIVAWINQRVLDLGLRTSFYPTVDIQRRDGSADRIEGTILQGDILHLDFGIEYLGLCTDFQQLAYVLKSDESEVPFELKKAMKIANSFEDIFFSACEAGMTGNDIFQSVLKKAAEHDISAMLYSHPIGYHCHGAGPLIGLYDKQESIPVRGDLQIEENTCYALEFNIRHFVPEWNKDIPIYLEETVCFKDNKMQYLTNRQKEFYLIHPNC